jgi:hypothetical protein
VRGRDRRGRHLAGAARANDYILDLSDRFTGAMRQACLAGPLGAQQYEGNVARLPTLKGFYEEEEVLEKLPVARLGREALENARLRPVSLYYSDMSLAMA